MNLFQSKKIADSVKTEVKIYDTQGDITFRQTFSNNVLTIKESFLYTTDKRLHQILKDFCSPKKLQNIRV